MKHDNLTQVGVESLKYHPSKVSWAMSRHIAKENPLFHRLLIYIFITTFILLLIYSLTNTVALSIKTKGSLEYDANVITVTNSIDVVVDQILVTDGKEVKEGDLLLVAKKQLTKDDIQKLLLQAKTAQSTVQQEEKGQCNKLCLQNLELLSQQSFSLTPNLSLDPQMMDFLVGLTKELKQYINQLKSSQVAPEGLGGIKTALSMARDKLRKIEAKGAQQLLAMEYEALKKEISDLNAQLASKSQGDRSSLYQARSALIVALRPLTQQLRNYKSDHELRAPKSGVVTFGEIGGPGELLSARSKIFKIIPTGHQLIAKILVLNKDISDLSRGDKVKISIDALPEREYGSIEGMIHKIPVGPVQDKNTGALNYEVLVSFKQQQLTDLNQMTKPLKLGMTLEAQIITKYRTLFWIGIKKLLNLKEEYLGDLY